MIDRVLAEKVMEHVQSIDNTVTSALARLLNGQAEQVEAEGLAVWDQGTWIGDIYDDEGNACGTAACFAGWTALMTGARWPDRSNIFVTAPGSNILVTVREHAQSVLGLSDHQAGVLFAGQNSLADLRYHLNDFYADEDAVVVQS